MHRGALRRALRQRDEGVRLAAARWRCCRGVPLRDGRLHRDRAIVAARIAERVERRQRPRSGSGRSAPRAAARSLRAGAARGPRPHRLEPDERRISPRATAGSAAARSSPNTGARRRPAPEPPRGAPRGCRRRARLRSDIGVDALRRRPAPQQRCGVSLAAARVRACAAATSAAARWSRGRAAMSFAVQPGQRLEAPRRADVRLVVSAGTASRAHAAGTLPPPERCRRCAYGRRPSDRATGDSATGERQGQIASPAASSASRTARSC